MFDMLKGAFFPKEKMYQYYICLHCFPYTTEAIRHKLPTREYDFNPRAEKNVIY